MNESVISHNNKRVAKNTLFLYFRMILLMGINLYTSRIILEALGVNDYGIYNIVGGVVAMFGFISGAMISSTQRYLNYYMGLEDDMMLGKVFNASVVVHIVISIIIVMLTETIGLWFLSEELVLPVNRYEAAFWTYQCAVIASVFVLISFPYNAAIIAHEKMNAYAYISIAEALLKLMIVFFLGLGGFDRLIMYAFLLMFVQLITTSLYVIYCRSEFKETILHFQRISAQLYKELVSFSGWNFIGNIANVCLTQGTNILLNLFFGPAVNAAKGISVQVQNTVGSFCNNFQLAQNPQIVKLYASKDYGELQKTVFRASRFSYYLVLVFCIPIIMKIDFILSIWLKKPPNYTGAFIQYSMFFCLVQALANPLFTASMATGNIKKIMSIVATLLMMVIPIGYLFLYIGADPISIFQIQLILYVVAHAARVIIVSKQVGFLISKYVRDVILPLSVVSVISFLSAYVIAPFFIDSILSLIIYCSVVISITTVVMAMFGMSKDEREFVFKVVSSKLSKYKL